jgi:hypothetical protein
MHLSVSEGILTEGEDDGKVFQMEKSFRCLKHEVAELFCILCLLDHQISGDFQPPVTQPHGHTLLDRNQFFVFHNHIFIPCLLSIWM